jgi:hypothetical protein
MPASHNLASLHKILTWRRTSLPQVFFAKVIRTATEDDVKVLFSQFGTVLEVSLFRAFQGAPTTKVDPVRLTD